MYTLNLPKDAKIYLYFYISVLELANIDTLL
jgi:hypothetical protein